MQSVATAAFASAVPSIACRKTGKTVFHPLLFSAVNYTPDIGITPVITPLNSFIHTMTTTNSQADSPKAVIRGPTAAANDAATSVADLRVSYSNQALDDQSAGRCPTTLFQQWMNNAIAANELEPNAMCLSTVDTNHRPSARMVLLKGYDHRGYVWYTNYDSRKGLQLSANPFAALTFWWPTLQRSVRIEGLTHRLNPAESDIYFHSRPAESQLGALVSDQSRELQGRVQLEARWQHLSQHYLDNKGKPVKPIQRPAHWGGFRLVPDRIEFWKGREARLHDRIVFERAEQNIISDSVEWTKTRLQP